MSIISATPVRVRGSLHSHYPLSTFRIAAPEVSHLRESAPQPRLRLPLRLLTLPLPLWQGFPWLHLRVHLGQRKARSSPDHRSRASCRSGTERNAREERYHHNGEIVGMKMHGLLTPVRQGGCMHALSTDFPLLDAEIKRASERRLSRASRSVQPSRGVNVRLRPTRGAGMRVGMR